MVRWFAFVPAGGGGAASLLSSKVLEVGGTNLNQVDRHRSLLECEIHSPRDLQLFHDLVFVPVCNNCVPIFGDMPHIAASCHEHVHSLPASVPRGNQDGGFACMCASYLHFTHIHTHIPDLSSASRVAP